MLTQRPPPLLLVYKKKKVCYEGIEESEVVWVFMEINVEGKKKRKFSHSNCSKC